MKGIDEAAAERALLDDLREELKLARQKYEEALGPAGRQAWLINVTILQDRIKAIEATRRES
jgi:hypothetical protein